jgi:hypothetical protein
MINYDKNISKDRLEKIEKFKKLREEIRKSGIMDKYFND